MLLNCRRVDAICMPGFIGGRCELCGSIELFIGFVDEMNHFVRNSSWDSLIWAIINSEV